MSKILEDKAIEISQSLKEIRDALRFANQRAFDKDMEQNVSQHRIGALNRISAAIEYINKSVDYPESVLNAFNEIKNILLGIKEK